jgi:hypothetical protein
LVAVPSLFFSFFLFIFFFCGWTRCQINTNPSREREKRERVGEYYYNETYRGKRERDTLTRHRAQQQPAGQPQL